MFFIFAQVAQVIVDQKKLILHAYSSKLSGYSQC